MTLLQQAQQEGLCLQFPEPLGQHREFTLENAVNMLSQAVNMANNRPFQWRYIDKPPEGLLAMLFLPPHTPFPNDGIRWQENETTHVMNAGANRELEVSEIKSGFVPDSQDHTAWRLRRRFRLLKGGHPNIVLVHYTRGPSTPIVPSLHNQPVRAYPLRTVAEPPTIVVGDKAGQKVYPPGPGGQMQQPPPGSAPPVMPGGPPGMANMGFNRAASQADLINHQNQAHEQLERRRMMEREKERAAAAAARDRNAGTTSGPHPQHPGHMQQYNYDEDEDLDSISTRSLALTRYKRNHDLMNEVFRQAAFGDKNRPPPPSPYSIFDKEDLESRTAKLEQEIELMKQKAAERRAKKLHGAPDVAMQDQGQLLTA